MKRNKGISLITLVITIVVIIILTGAIVLSLSQNNPITKATESVAASNLATLRDQFSIAYGTDLALNLGDASKITVDSLTTKMGGASAIPAGFQVTTSGIVYTGADPVMQAVAASKGIPAIIPTGFVISSVVGENKIEDGLVIIDNSGTSTNGNEFVWIPVSAPFARIGYIYGASASTTEVMSYFSDYTEPLAYSGTNAAAWETSEYASMIASVAKYGGFYVARYEAGDPGAVSARISTSTKTTIPVSKKNQQPYIFINWGTTTLAPGTTSSAVYLSQQMYPSSTSVKSTLIYSIQWDNIMKFIMADSTKNVSNSIDWGNYTGSTGAAATNCGVLQTTGKNEAWKAKNIYDIAGNVAEWTMEGFWDVNRGVRGGGYWSASVKFAAARGMNGLSSTNGDGGIAFRPALYLK